MVPSPQDKRQESARFMLQTSTIAREIKITSERKREIGELEGEGMHGEPGQPVKLKGLMIFVEDSFFFLQSRVDSKIHDLYAPEFARIFDSFKLEKP
jgi:hypothetical protein